MSRTWAAAACAADAAAFAAAGTCAASGVAPIAAATYAVGAAAAALPPSLLAWLPVPLLPTPPSRRGTYASIPQALNPSSVIGRRISKFWALGSSFLQRHMFKLQGGVCMVSIFYVGGSVTGCRSSGFS